MTDFTSNRTGLDFHRDFRTDVAPIPIESAEVIQEYRDTALEVLKHIYIDRLNRDNKVTYHCTIENIEIDNPALLLTALRYAKQSMTFTGIDNEIEDFISNEYKIPTVLNITIKNCKFLFTKGVCDLKLDFTNLLSSSDAKKIKNVSIHISNSEIYHLNVLKANELRVAETKGTIYLTSGDNPVLSNIEIQESDLVLVTDIYFNTTQLSPLPNNSTDNHLYAMHRSESRETSTVLSFVEDTMGAVSAYEELSKYHALYYTPTPNKVTLNSYGSSLLLINLNDELMLPLSGDNDLVTPSIYKQIADYDLFLLHPDYTPQDNIKNIFSYDLESPYNPEESLTEDVQDIFKTLLKTIYAIESKEVKMTLGDVMYKMMRKSENPIQKSYLYQIIDNLAYLVK